MKLARAIDGMEWYAIKIMKEHQINSAEKLTYFMNEVKLLSQCTGNHIVELISVSISGTITKSNGLKKAAVYCVMCYARHGEIYKLIRETGQFTEALARTIFIQLIEGTVDD